MPDSEYGIVLSEIELAIAHLDVLLSVLLELVLVDVRHDFKAVRKHICELVLVNNQVLKLVPILNIKDASNYKYKRDRKDYLTIFYLQGRP